MANQNHSLRRRISALGLAAILLLSALASCDSANIPSETDGQTDRETAATTDPGAGEVDMAAVNKEINSLAVSDFRETDEVTEYVMMTVKDHGTLVLRLRADVAPITVKNFQDLAADGFYDGLTFHRVIKGFMLQGGDPDGNGTGGSGKPIKGEYEANGVKNELKGVISMARRSNDMNSATSQFFICNDDARRSLDGMYAAFGYVVAGLDTVDSISDVEVTYSATGEKSSPVETVVIEKVCFVKKP